MDFIEPSLELVLEKLQELKSNQQPLWGSLNGHQMVEHLSVSIRLAKGELEGIELAIPEEKVEKAQLFLTSEHPMPRNFKVSFAPENPELRNESMAEALAEFEKEWKSFDQLFSDKKGLKTLHPSFGLLNYEQWMLVHKKHLTHHLQQFGLI